MDVRRTVENLQVRHIRLPSMPELERGCWNRFRWQNVLQINGSTYRLSPVALWKIGIKQHAPAHLDQVPILPLGNTILLGGISCGELR